MSLCQSRASNETAGRVPGRDTHSGVCSAACMPLSRLSGWKHSMCEKCAWQAHSHRSDLVGDPWVQHGLVLYAVAGCIAALADDGRAVPDLVLRVCCPPLACNV